MPTVWPVGAAKKQKLQNTCTCTARAHCTPAHYIIRRQVGLAKVHPCTKFGVPSSKFPKTGGPHVKKSFPPLARAACAPLERHPERILSWGGMHVTCVFDIGSATRLTCRCVNVFLQTFSRLHVPRATCRRSTPDRHHRCSGGSARRLVPPPSRSDQPFGRYSPKCLDIHAD